MTKRKRILVSDNNNALLKHLSIMLKKMGFSVVSINEGFEIFKAVASDLPNLIILDVDISKAAGLKILNYLKTNKTTSSIPVVMLAGDDSDKTKDTCYEKGCDAFMVKPVRLKELHDILQQFIYSPEGYTRKYLRVNVNCNVKVIKEASTYIMESETLSEKGIYINYDNPFPVNSHVFINLPLYDGDSIQLEGKVIYINTDTDPNNSLSRGMAVEFVEADDDCMSLVSEYVKGILNIPACNSIRLDKT
jgi:CheY-like chemotaxis protein/Tfp pilus assembly protein PilZ